MAFNTVGAVSANRIMEIFGSAFGIPLSTGTVNNMVCGVAEKVDASVTEIRNRVTQSAVALRY